ncbi:hypothetical protein [Aureispira anguillae]|uniref:Lipoprotein n=1 Tax=Aureispira anguillae TaxID=2864201 RepID=A0A915YE87_9BACT|nr:hypothetical protein [Aureispira anguillae]BDS11507.1 hypothetical protein AsAng_0022210 [Aureispira anguillae]
MNKILSLLFILAFINLSCNNSADNNQLSHDNESKPDIDKSVSKHSVPLKKLLADSKEKFPFEHLEIEPFSFFKTFRLHESSKNAFYIKLGENDKFFEIEIYELKNKEWFLIAKNDILEADYFQFDLKIEDYNFDGFKDFYIQTNASNGLTLSHGYLLVYDKEKNRLLPLPYGFLHSNIRPDRSSKNVKSDEKIMCKEDGDWAYCEKTLKWEKDSLIEINKTCPCTPEL